ncbi:MAG TPA: IS481 family transposase [Mycobacterium sp.]|nr:IS481 family transposase [Mycobacterium sp.]
MARVLIMAVTVEGRTKSEVARDYGVTRQWVQTLVRRYQLEGEAAFEPHSRRPRSSPHRIGQDVEDAIVALRKQLAEAGHDAGAETIVWHLRERTGSAPSVATVWRVLSRRGFVTPQPHKRPRSSWHRFQAELPNELWQADITHWQLADATEVEILDILDDHSRLLVGATARSVFKAGHVVADLHAAIARHGRPERLLTDNGAVFTGHYRGRGWVALEREAAALGIALAHSRPYHPTTCGKVERVHQTLKNWLTRQPAASTVAELQAQLDTFADYYNTERPHRSIGRRTPAAAWAARPRATPARQGIQISEHFRVRKDRIDRDGKLTLRHASRLHHIGIGHDWAGTRVFMLIRELKIRIIAEDTGELIRELELDPNRDYQPSGRDRHARWRH